VNLLALWLGCVTSGEEAPPIAADCWADDDGDSFGDADSRVTCDRGVVDATDCDDGVSEVRPDGPELCNGRDDDCDGRVDDADDDLADGLPFYEDGDGDGYGAEVVTRCALAAGVVLVDGDCDDADPSVHPSAEEGCDGVDRDCDGVGATAVGSGAACPAPSCLEARSAAGDGAEDGVYWLALPSGTVTPAWCDMQTDGGGWTLAFLRNSASTGSQGDFGLGDVSPEVLSVSPEEASTTSAPRLGWIDLNQYEWEELRLGGYAAGVETYVSRSIPRDELRLRFGEDGYFLYGGPSGYYWCGGDASYTDYGVGAVDNPPDAPLNCRGHGSLGSGWDFSEYTGVNLGLTLCGGDGSAIMTAAPGGGWIGYGASGGAQALWVR
jgi:hypothetical protein